MESVLIIVLGITVTTLGCVWMGISYSKKANGYENGASQREIEALQKQVQPHSRRNGRAQKGS